MGSVYKQWNAVKCIAAIVHVVASGLVSQREACSNSARGELLGLLCCQTQLPIAADVTTFAVIRLQYMLSVKRLHKVESQLARCNHATASFVLVDGLAMQGQL